MTLILSGTDGLSDIDGSAATPAIRGTDTNTGIFFPAADTIAFSEGGVEAMRLTSAGSLQIGSTSGSAPRLLVYTSDNTDPAILARQDGTAPIQIWQAPGTERARIDNSGNLLVGTTTADGRITAHASTSNSSSSVLVGNTSAGNTLIRIRADGLYNLGLQTNSPYNFTSTGANAILFSDGTFGRATSSLKYKRNVEDASHGLSDVLKIRPVTYKSKNERDGETVFGGLIAEEIDALGLNEFVQYAEDGTPDSIYYANMVSLAFKAIQEQQAIIQSLTARIEALEGK